MPQNGPTGAHDRETGRGLYAVWLFPATYAVHLLEEYLQAGGFPAWVKRAVGIQISDGEFVAWNAFAFGLMCVGAWLVARDRKFRFIEIALALAVLGNAGAHLIGSFMTWTYSPGLVSGVALWTPLGWLRFKAAWGRCSRRARISGIGIGGFAAIVPLAVLAWGFEGP